MGTLPSSSSEALPAGAPSTGEPPPAAEQRVAERVFRIVAVASLSLIVVIITADTVLRYVFKAPTTWSQEVAGLALFLLFCAGMLPSWQGRFHVRMDLVHDRLPAAARTAVDVLTALAAALFGGFLAVQAVLTTLRTWSTKASMPSGDIPQWPFALVGALAFATFFLMLLVGIARHLRGRRHGA